MSRIMSGLDVARFVLTVIPLAVKVTQLAVCIFNAYPSEEEYQDTILALNVQDNIFSIWVGTCRFTSQRALQYRLRSSQNQDVVIEHFTLASSNCSKHNYRGFHIKYTKTGNGLQLREFLRTLLSNPR
ncbi:hypothetical protein EV426DRAFT_575052 [Tirmania nivea]|nr:hypothetical protein EV426DRAFT_575052 [Tirmania nivea]